MRRSTKCVFTRRVMSQQRPKRRRRQKSKPRRRQKKEVKKKKKQNEFLDNLISDYEEEGQDKQPDEPKRMVVQKKQVRAGKKKPKDILEEMENILPEEEESDFSEDELGEEEELGSSDEDAGEEEDFIEEEL